MLHGAHMYFEQMFDCLIGVRWSTVSSVYHVGSAIGIIRDVEATNTMKLSNEARAIEATQSASEERG